ncbi:FAD-dependent monooxygenase [Mesobacillus foraminis]|uniref:FAD-dependent oxidoreductase n=1 Tax=Mesobacillus foraminis TaxID=279826 RepID=UPI0039A33272
MSKTVTKNKAIIIGGSIAGKLAARVLSDFAEEVIIVEKDPKCEQRLPRTSVPQGFHGHALLKSGEEALEELFPGIVDELIADGAVPSDFASELSWYHHGSWKVQFKSGVSIIQQSRPFLEEHIQRRLELIPNISFQYETKVKGVVVKENRAIGVSLTTKNGNISELFADIVVDASGAGSATPRWLKELGLGVPHKTEVKVDLFYSSRKYPSLSPKNGGSLLIYPNPPLQNLGGAIAQIEDNEWMVTLLGYGVKHPPFNDEQFINYTKQLDDQGIYDTIKDADPVTPVSFYRFPSLSRYHYDNMKHFPDGLIVIGDAFSRINPVFAQGMSIAALEALALKKELSKREGNPGKPKHLSKKIHRRFSRITDIPWLIALSEDFRFKTTSGKKPFGLPFLQWYVKKVIIACSRNTEVYGQFIKVLHLKAHPITLFSPKMMLKIFASVKKSNYI